MKRRNWLHIRITADVMETRIEKKFHGTLGGAKREAVRNCKSLLAHCLTTKGSFTVEIQKELDTSWKRSTLAYRTLKLRTIGEKIHPNSVTYEKVTKWFDTPEGVKYKDEEIIHDTRCFEWSD